MFEKDELVWAKSTVGRQIFWPAKVIDGDQVLAHRKKKPAVACVQFLVEGTCEAIMDSKKLLPFHCKQKHDLLKKGRGQIDPHKICQFDSAVKQAEQQIKSSKCQSINPIYFEAAKTTTNQFEANSGGKDSATDLPKIIDFPKNNSANLKSDELCETLEGKNCSNTIVRKTYSTRGTKRPFDFTEKGNGPNDGKVTCKQKKKNKIGKNVKKNSFCNASAGINESISGKNSSGEKSNVSSFQPSMDVCINLRKLNTVTHTDTVIQNKYGTNYSNNEDNATDVSTSNLNGVSQSISNGSCKLGKIDNQDSGVEKMLFYNDDLKKDSKYELETPVNNSNSEDEWSLPEAFSSSPAAECSDFRSGDLVWAKYRKWPYWPAQIDKVTGKRNRGRCSVFFLPKQSYGSLKVNKKNMIPYACDTEIYERYKNQEIQDSDKYEFDLALKEAEDILVRKASKKVDAFFPEDEGIRDDDSFLSTEFKEPCENNGREELDQQLDNREEESVPLKTPELRRSKRERRSVSKYNEILLQFHCCKSKLVKIFHEKVPSDRHQKFRYGTVAEKDFLKRKTGFGPIQDDEICDKIVERLRTWYFEVQEEALQSNYIYDVWLPEAIIFFIMRNENVKRDEAEQIYLDPARNVSKKDADDVTLWFRNHKIDESAKQECLERAKRAFQFR